MTRTKLTIEAVLNNPKYQNILYLLVSSEEHLQFIHLRYALCKNHGLKLSPYQENKIKEHFGNSLEELKKYTKDFEKTKFNSFQSLGNALTRLKKLKLIEPKKNKKKYPFYSITSNGFYHETLWYINWYINNTFPKDIVITKDMEEKKIIQDISKFKINVMKELNNILFKRLK